MQKSALVKWLGIQSVNGGNQFDLVRNYTWLEFAFLHLIQKYFFS